MEFIAPTWDRIYSQCIKLAENLSHSGKYEVIVGVSRGGLALTRIMSDLLDVQNVMITRCEYYVDLGKTKKHPVITQKIQGSLQGKKVLLLDDVADSGKSLVAIKKYLSSKSPKSLTVATLYVKPWTVIVPDFFIGRTGAWIVFPWELYEAMKSVSAKGGLSQVRKTGIPQKFAKQIAELHPSTFS
ncbi:MAG: phosphoribosyltransferase [Nitrososphaerales archaeon]